MKKFLYMNHRLKDKGPEPKIVVQTGDSLVYCNEARLVQGGKVVARLLTGKLKQARLHQVIAWVETRLEVEVK